jgi:hypothetical protein
MTSAGLRSSAMGQKNWADRSAHVLGWSSSLG